MINEAVQIVMCSWLIRNLMKNIHHFPNLAFRPPKCFLGVKACNKRVVSIYNPELHCSCFNFLTSKRKDFRESEYRSKCFYIWYLSIYTVCIFVLITVTVFIFTSTFILQCYPDTHIVLPLYSVLFFISQNFCFIWRMACKSCLIAFSASAVQTVTILITLYSSQVHRVIADSPAVNIRVVQS